MGLSQAERHSASQEFPSPVTEPKVRLPCSQEPATGPYPDPDESINFNIISPSTHDSSKRSLPPRLSNENVLWISCFPYRVRYILKVFLWRVCVNWLQFNRTMKTVVQLSFLCSFVSWNQANALQLPVTYQLIRNVMTFYSKSFIICCNAVARETVL
jgi:hypothetical protein